MAPRKHIFCKLGVILDYPEASHVYCAIFRHLGDDVLGHVDDDDDYLGVPLFIEDESSHEIMIVPSAQHH